MRKLEKRVAIAAAVFVAIYLLAIAITIHSRMAAPPLKESKFETVGPTAKERDFILAELLLPMLIVGVVTACFIALRRRQARRKWASEEDEVDFEYEDRQDAADDTESAATPPDPDVSENRS